VRTRPVAARTINNNAAASSDKEEEEEEDRTGQDAPASAPRRARAASRSTKKRSEAKQSEASRASDRSESTWPRRVFLAPALRARYNTDAGGWRKRRRARHGTARHGTEETETKARAGGRVVGRERGRNTMKAEGGCCSRQTREKVRAIESETHQQTARKSQQRSCVRRSRRRRPKEEERTEVDGRVERR